MRPRARILAATSLFALVATFPAATANALDFQVDFRRSTYQTAAGDSFADLLAQHQSETLIQSNVTTGLEDISTAIYAAGVNRDYSILMQTTLEIGVSGEYRFQVGTDWGRGGASALIDNATGAIVDERVITDDVWWANDWNNSDVFTTTFAFTAGDSYTLAWVGFEGCCGGSSTVRFSFEGGAFTPLTSTTISPLLVPEPSTALSIGLGLAAMSRCARPRRAR